MGGGENIAVFVSDAADRVSSHKLERCNGKAVRASALKALAAIAIKESKSSGQEPQIQVASSAKRA